tara:strand:+ start:69 stop:446 length:378 start_codon:yes stop_codon:yes gene_type:complete
MNYLLGLTLTGIVSGIFAGLIGAGAEILIVPMLTLFGILSSLKSRIGTSLIMLLPPIGIFAAIKFYKTNNADVFGGLYMALIFTIFSLISSNYSIMMNPDILRKIFAIFTIIAGVYIYFTKEEIN